MPMSPEWKVVPPQVWELPLVVLDFKQVSGSLPAAFEKMIPYFSLTL